MRARKCACSWRPTMGAAAIGVLACSLVVYGAPGATPGSLVGKELRPGQRVVEVRPPTGQLAVPPGMEGRFDSAPQDATIVVIEAQDDASIAAGRVANAAGVARIFQQDFDSGFFEPRKVIDDVGIAGLPPHYTANWMWFGNGFTGGPISGYDLLVYNSVGFSGTAGVIAELWTGDPFGIDDTACGDPPAPIAGTQCKWSNLAQALDICPGGSGKNRSGECVGLYQLSCDLSAAKPVVNCDHVWMVMWLNEGCRLGWRYSYIAPAQIGSSDYIQGIYECGEFGACGPNYDQYSTGHCCEDQSIACDHSDGTYECVHPTFCADNANMFLLDNFLFGGGGYWASFVANIYAPTDTNAKVVPVMPPASSKHSATATYTTRSKGGKKDNEAVLAKGGEPVWMEMQFNPLDPNGPKIKAYEVDLDAAGYSNGLGGDLTVFQVDCSADASVCTSQIGPESICGTPGYPAGECPVGVLDTSRSDFIFAGQASLCAVDVSTPNYRYGCTLLGLPISQPDVQTYAGTLILWVPPDAKGTYEIGLFPPPSTVIVDENGQFIPLMGLVPGKITVELGQCCDLSSQPFTCISDTMTANECAAAGGNFTLGKTCADDCGCTDDSQCADGDACTVDTCGTDSACHNTAVSLAADECCNPNTTQGSADDLGGGGAVASNNDGNDCTADECDKAGSCAVGAQCGAPINPPLSSGTPCDDGEPCLTVKDQCDGNGLCVGQDILTVPCTSNAICEAQTGGLASCNLVNGFCRCVPPSLQFDIHASEKPNANCFDQSGKITVDVVFRDVPVPVTGGQFVVLYDPSCVSFNSISPGGGGFVTEIRELVDRANGAIFYAVGVDPFGGAGVAGDGTLASMSFTKLAHPGCSNCSFDFGGANPLNTYLVDDAGQMVQDVEPRASKEIHVNDRLTLSTPDDVKVNADCNAATAMVNWPAPWAASSCARPGCDPSKEKCYGVDLVCTGTHESGLDMTALAMHGGEHPQGVTAYSCTATSTICGDSITEQWTVTVNDTSSLDVEVQLSPVIAGDVTRCIKFGLYSDCVTPPTVFSQDVHFGGLFDFVGKFTEPKKIPKGQWVCMTAGDQLHTLRSASAVICRGDGSYAASFTGDPFFGGNWLIGGNLDGWDKNNSKASLDVIDILDFGTFVSQYSTAPGANTPCGTQGPHADVNGDGVVDSLDFSFVMMNFLASSKNACCADGVAGAPVGRTEVSVRELRQWGMSDLAVADLNGDGLVNMEDMNAFLAGQVPTKKAPNRTRGGSGISSRR